MRRKKKRRLITSLILLIMLFFMLFLAFSYIENYKQLNGYDIINKYFESIKHFSLSEFKLNSLRTLKVCGSGYKESISQFLNIISATDVDKESNLDSYYIFIDGNNYDMLMSDLPKSSYQEVDGFLVYQENQMQDVKLRLRGNGANHWYYTQKSWRVKTDRTELINGARKLNLVNPSEKSAMTSTLSYWLGDKMEILSTSAEPIRVFLNNKYMGLAISLEQTDAYFLKNNDRLLSDIYAGDLIKNENGDLSDSYLWRNRTLEPWQKMSEYGSIPINDFSNLETLIDFVANNYSSEFDYDVEKFVDIEKYLNWKACMLIIGSTHCTNMHNTKLYFDPSSGKIEPILWDTDSFSYKDEPNLKIDMIFHDLDRVIMRNPEFADRVYRIMWDTINGVADKEAILQTLNQNYNNMKTSVYSDIYKDVNGVDPLRMSRAFTNREFDESIEEMRFWIEERYAFINKNLSKTILWYELKPISDKSIAIIMDPNGYSGAYVSKIVLDGIEDQSDVKLYQDMNFNNIIDKMDMLIFDSKIKDGTIPLNKKIYPLKHYQNIEALDYKYQPANLKNDQRGYNFLFDTGKNDASNIMVVDIVAQNTVVGSKLKVYEKSDAEKYEENEELVFSTHPWTIVSDDQDDTIILSAGEHLIKDDFIIDKSSSLTIKPGAILKMSEGKSIYVYGKLDINGTAENPVIIEPAVTDKPWGVFAIQGHYNPNYVHTIDSAIISGGGVPQIFENAIYTGMLSTYNADLTMTNTTISSNVVGDDGFNAKQCKVTIDHCIFENAFSDAIDLEYVKGSIINCYFENNGSDSINLTTSAVDIENNFVIGSKGCGILIDENSDANVYNNVVDSCMIGMQVKDASKPMIKNNVIIDNMVGVSVVYKNDRYEKGGRGTIANSIIANSVLKTVFVDKDSKLKIKDSIFDQAVVSSKDLTLENCVLLTVNLDGDFMMDTGNVGLKQPIEMWWLQ
jgi:parallel beta-helix repeat protein